MRPSSPHPVVACFVDIWFVEAASSIVIDYLRWPTDLKWRIAAHIAVALVLLALPIIYHIRWARHATFLTPGEITTGVFLQEGRKVWLSAYHGNRQLLYGCVIWALFVNIPEATTDIPPFVEFALGLLVLPCLLAIGRGEPFGLFGLAAYRLWQANAASAPLLGHDKLPQIVEAYAESLLFAAVCVGVAISYKRQVITAPAPLRAA